MAGRENRALGALVVLAGLVPGPAAGQLEIEHTLGAWMGDASALAVRVDSEDGRGSGALVARRHVLTALHVVGDEHEASVGLADGRTLRAHVIGTDIEHDLALLSLPEDAGRCAPMATVAPDAGAWVALAGTLGGIEHELPATASIGMVLDTSGDLMLDAGIAHGMSGGPVLSTSGEIVGVVVRLDAAARARGPLLDGVHCEDAPIARDIPARAFDAEAWNTQRDLALAALVPAPERSFAASVVELTDGWVSMRGVAIAPDLVLTVADAHVLSPTDCAHWHLGRHDGPACTESIVRGELMRLRFPRAGLTPLGEGPTEALDRGSLLVDAGGYGHGVVDATDAAPGDLVPYVPVLEHGCGTMAHRRREQSPRVTLGRVIAHDVPSIRGSLLVDAQGLPAAIDVGHHVTGRGYAVPIADALARFRPPR